MPKMPEQIVMKLVLDTSDIDWLVRMRAITAAYDNAESVGWCSAHHMTSPSCEALIGVKSLTECERVWVRVVPEIGDTDE